jgi:nitrite reductase/ring-hydroxylating ferredoxin subunit
MELEAETRRWDAGASADLPERGRLVVDAGDVSIGIFRVDGQLHAYENRCAHMGGPICQGLIVPGVVEILDERRAIAGSRFDESDLHIACPWHGAEFSIVRGCHAGKADMKLRRIAVEEAHGRIYVRP